jgi:hypothetical protein
VTTIHRDNTDRLSVADAKRLILEAVPRERAFELYVGLDSEGNPVLDGPIEMRVNENANIQAAHLDCDFVDTCKELGIVPRMKYRPVIKNYNGATSQDDFYTIAHDEFVRLASVFDLMVVVGDAPKPQASMPAPVADSASNAPVTPRPLATGDVAHAFDGLRGWDEKAWKETLGSPPKWLEVCIKLRGQRGIRAHHWDPVLIGAALVRGGYAKANNIRARFQTKPQLSEWLEAWKTYEADNFDAQ